MFSRLGILFKRVFQRRPSFPKGVVAIRIVPDDSRISEEWYRDIHDQHINLHSVIARKHKNKPYPWQLYFGAGQFIREEPFASGLSDAIKESILNVRGTVEAHRERHEKFVVAGDIHGGELVRNVAKGIDAFLRQNRHKWELQSRRTDQ